MTKDVNPNAGVAAAIAAADAEHAAQLMALNQLESAITRGAGESETAPLLDELIEHTNAHFLSEQLLMRLHVYEAYEAHVQEHDQLMAEVRRVRERLALGDSAAAQGIVAALRNWIMIHLQTTDAVLHEYLRRRARGQQSVEGELLEEQPL